MRAAWYDRQGQPDVLQTGQIERPEPRAGEVLVKVAASGVNPSDTYFRQGTQGPMAFPRVVPNQDGAGIIEAVGEGVSQDRVGERVWVYESTLNRPSGTAAEYTVVPSRRAIRLPDEIDFASGACLGIPALTAHRSVFTDGPVTGQTLLITGGAGAVGSTAIQFARWGGATVITTVSSDAKAEVARASGAQHIINYRTQDVVAEVKRLTDGRGVERVVDVDFGGNLAASVDALAANGTIASYATRGNTHPTVPFRSLMVKNITVHAILVYSMPESAKETAVEATARVLREGALKPVIGATMTLDQIVEAHAAVEKGSVIGNLVVNV